MPSETITAAPPATQTSARRGALTPAPKGGVHPCFSLLIALATIDCAALLFLPYLATRFGDDPWSTAARAAFVGKAIASGLAFGLTASISADRRNRSPWWFLSGHMGVVLAAIFAVLGRDLSHPFESSLAVVATGFLGSAVALFASAKPKASPAPLDPILLSICRGVHAISNVKFGIVLLAAVGIAVQFGSIHENRFNSKAAHFDVYRSWWFVSLWFLAGMSMLSATFRKWPWRLEQTGWLTVHAGLTIVVVGTMMSFFSATEGQIALSEGETEDAISLDGSSRIRVEEVGRTEDGRRFRRKVLDVKSAFDSDPITTRPNKSFVAPLGTADGDVTIVCDAYFCHAKPYETWHDDAPAERAGVELDIFIGGSNTPARTLRLDEVDQPTESLPFGASAFQIELPRLNAAVYESLIRKDEPEGRGKLVFRDATGAVVGELPVVAESRPAGVDDGEAAIATGTTTIGAAEASLLRYADNLSRFPGATGIVDMSAGIPKNPGVLYRLQLGELTEERTALSFLPTAPAEAERQLKSPFPYVASYEYRPKLALEGPLLLLTPTPSEFRFIYVSSGGEAVDGPVKIGEPLPIPAPMLRFVPKRIATRLRIDRGFEFAGFKDDGPPAAARFRVRAPGAEEETLWLRRDGRAQPFEAGGRLFALSWAPERRPLGFSLKLNEFLREFYPGSTSEKTFESYLELKHPEKFPTPVDVKIDMNRPLRLDGWRLYQSRFGADDATTFLQVNRDPGLSVIYPACSVVLLGIVVVSFLKNGLRERRRRLEAVGASPMRAVFEGAAIVALVGAPPLVFGFWAAAGLPQSGALAFLAGLILVVVVPAIFVAVLSRRLAGPSAARAAESAS